LPGISELPVRIVAIEKPGGKRNLKMNINAPLPKNRLLGVNIFIFKLGFLLL
jgi:hypothetical protein